MRRSLRATVFPPRTPALTLSHSLASSFHPTPLLHLAASALIFAYKNRLDISLGIAIGSATQIAMFVIPVLVLIGWCIGQPLSLDFQPFEVGVLLLSVLICSFVLLDGRSHWMQGTLLIGCYAIVATAFGLHGSHHE